MSPSCFQWFRNLLTRPMTEDEWEEIRRDHPKIEKLYLRGILTEKEAARKFRQEKIPD